MKLKWPKIIITIPILGLCCNCYFYDYFKESAKPTTTDTQNGQDEILGEYLASKAGEKLDAALDTIHAITSDYAPAAIRPDPDEYARSLLRQYRKEGDTIAQNIAKLENYRLLLGGGPLETISPKSDFDSTSLLANIKISEAVCEALLNPNKDNHGNWETIIPFPSTDWQNILSFLIQRFLGVPKDSIDATMLEDGKEILDSYNPDGNYTYGSYVPVCTTLASSAEGLML